MENELSYPRSGLSSTPRFSGVLRAERANVNRFNGFHPAVSAALDKAAMRPFTIGEVSTLGQRGLLVLQPLAR